MAKVKTKIGNDYCPQALFLYGTKQEDGQPHFGLFVGLDIIIPQRDSG